MSLGIEAIELVFISGNRSNTAGKKIKILNETTRGYCAQEELQFRPKPSSSKGYLFNYSCQRVKVL